MPAFLDAALAATEAMPELASWQPKLRELHDRLPQPPRIAVVGLVKAGKSSLLNALLDAPDRFRVGDARTTVSVEEAPFEDCLLVDTPGFDAEMEDSRRALAGFNGSDGWLIVHSCQAGEFDAEEVRSLEAMRAELHGAALEPALLTCVLSKSDTRDPSEVESIERRCREQLASVLGMENTHWVRTGVEAYFEAQALGRARRVEASGLPALRTRVAEMVNTVRLRREALAEERAVAIMTEARELFRTRADEATRLEKKLVRERRERFARIREELAELGTAMRETLTVAQGGK